MQCHSKINIIACMIIALEAMSQSFIVTYIKTRMCMRLCFRQSMHIVCMYIISKINVLFGGCARLRIRQEFNFYTMIGPCKGGADSRGNIHVGPIGLLKSMLLHRYERLYGNGYKATGKGGGVYKERAGCSLSLLLVFASKFSEHC